MIIVYRNTVIGATYGNQIYDFLTVLQDSALADIFNSNYWIPEQCPDSVLNKPLQEDEVLRINTLPPATSPLLVNMAKLYAPTLGTPLLPLINFLKKADQLRNIATGTDALQSELQLNTNSRLAKKHASWLNQVNGFSKQTARLLKSMEMKSPLDTILYRLPTPDDIVKSEGICPLSPISHLYKLGQDFDVSVWVNYIGIENETIYIGSSSNDKGIFDNEKLLYDELNTLSEEVIKKTVQGLDPNATDLTKYLPIELKEFYKRMIYFVLKHNWKHTGLVYTDVAMEMTSEDDDENDEANSAKQSTLDLGMSLEYSEILHDRLKKAYMARGQNFQSNLIVGLLDTTLQYIDSTQKAENNYKLYIETIIKLLRFGSRRIKNLELEEVYTYRNLNMETGIVYFNEDKCNDKKLSVDSFGHGLIPVQTVFIDSNIHSSNKNTHKIHNQCSAFCVGLVCVQLFETDNLTTPLQKHVFVDPYAILEAYTDESKIANRLCGIFYKDGKFISNNDEGARVLENGIPKVSSDTVYSKISFNTILPIRSEFWTKELENITIENKKNQANMLSMMTMLTRPLSSIPEALLKPINTCAQLYNAVCKRVIDKGDPRLPALLCDVLEVIPTLEFEPFKVADKITSSLTRKEITNVYGQKNDESSLPIVNIQTAMPINNGNDQLIAYITAQYEIVSPQSSIEKIACKPKPAHEVYKMVSSKLSQLQGKAASQYVLDAIKFLESVK